MKVRSVLNNSVWYDADGEGVVWVIWRRGHAYLGLEYNGGGGIRINKILTPKGKYSTKSVMKACDNRFCVWHLHTVPLPMKNGQLIEANQASCGNVHADKKVSFKSMWCRRTYEIQGDRYSGWDVWKENARGKLMEDKYPQHCKLKSAESVIIHLMTWNSFDDHEKHFNDADGFQRTGAVIEKWLVDIMVENCDEVAFGDSPVGAKVQTKSFKRWFGGFTKRSGWSEDEIRNATNCITAVYDILNAHGITFSKTMNLASFFLPGKAISIGGLKGKIKRGVG